MGIVSFSNYIPRERKRKGGRSSKKRITIESNSRLMSSEAHYPLWITNILGTSFLQREIQPPEDNYELIA